MGKIAHLYLWDLVLSMDLLSSFKAKIVSVFVASSGISCINPLVPSSRKGSH
jgi:hypothetical protein